MLTLESATNCDFEEVRLVEYRKVVLTMMLNADFEVVAVFTGMSGCSKIARNGAFSTYNLRSLCNK